jgi:hypothetical protein
MMARIIAAMAVLLALVPGCGPVKRAGDLSDSGGLGSRVGSTIVIVGYVSSTPWQHMVDPRPSHPRETYFDMGSGQIVVYSREPIECAGAVRITGKVIVLEGSSKDPRRKETCTEYQVLADSWECLK